MESELRSPDRKCGATGTAPVCLMPAMETEECTGYDVLLRLEEKKTARPARRLRWHVMAPWFLTAAAAFSLFFLTSISDVLLPAVGRTCVKPRLRREWRTLSIKERQEYILAVNCLSQTPSRLGLNTSRYDDFVYVHLQGSNTTHDVAISLPWHRYYIQQYEKALCNECGYRGSFAYWDWTLDAVNPALSPIWSTDSGFGGDGSPPGNCLREGPLAGMRPQYPRPHCLGRKFTTDDGMHGSNYTATKVEQILDTADTYHDFRFALENGPHRYVHRGIGGEMPTPHSTNDPIFFVHHAQIDRLWWKWQRKAVPSRRLAYDAIERSHAADSKPWLTPDSWKVSLDDPILMYGLARDVKVADVMSTESSLFCYRYTEA